MFDHPWKKKDVGKDSNHDEEKGELEATATVTGMDVISSVVRSNAMAVAMMKDSHYIIPTLPEFGGD